ncbi:hypothetical protein [Polyangium spumosum]|uniref:Uncharacterized protein n=1 Tax=Polyangium spumosum TaxID=889282 RepID=A0A6N7PK85_9BACT|nr:hypothetical protein [Polyangium spumosum]MRG90514.1 hypothetical protein [Polyangium spumosum]
MPATLGEDVHGTRTLAQNPPRPNPPRRASLLVALACLSLAACRDRPRPWEQAGGAVDASSPPPTPPLPKLPPSMLGEAPTDADGGVAEAGRPLAREEDPVASPVRVGGPWVRCYGNFRLEGDPRKDLTRLTMLCGPANGMRRVTKEAFEGEVAEGGAPVSFPLKAKKGECYRVFAVADPTVTDLDVVVRSSRGTSIAKDHGEDRWPIVQPDRPFCPLEDDTLTVELAARRGKGTVVAEVWGLRVSMSD